MRDVVTTGLEILGCCAVVAGAFVLFGLGVSLIVAGIGLAAVGYLASGGAE